MLSSSASSLIQILRHLIPRPGPEAHLAEDVQATLRRSGVAVETEVQLTEGRVDARVDGTVLELKVQGSSSTVIRQLTRYARDPEVVDIVLVTTASGLRQMPTMIAGKAIYVVYLPRL